MCVLYIYIYIYVIALYIYIYIFVYVFTAFRWARNGYPKTDSRRRTNLAYPVDAPNLCFYAMLLLSLF